MNIQLQISNETYSNRESLQNQPNLPQKYVKEMIYNQQQLENNTIIQSSYIHKNTHSNDHSSYSRNMQEGLNISQEPNITTSSYYDDEIDEMNYQIDYSSSEQFLSSVTSQQISYRQILNDEQQQIKRDDKCKVDQAIYFSNQKQDNQIQQLNSVFSSKPIETHYILDQSNKVFVLMGKETNLNLNIEDSNKTNEQENKIQNGIKFINSITHRIDQQCIEINMESLNLKIDQNDNFIHKLKENEHQNSLLNQYIEKALSNSIKNQNYIPQIQQQLNDSKFVSHLQNRKQASNEKFIQITSQIDPTQLLIYIRHSINYEQGIIQSTVAGYTPALYELLCNDSYEFKELILKKGFIDPTTWMEKLDDSLIGSSQFLNAPSADQIQLKQTSYEIEIISSDNQIFPSFLNVINFNLQEDYDKEHNLEFNYHENLVFHQFTLKDPESLKQLKQKRSQMLIPTQIKSPNKKQCQNKERILKNNELLDKYYGDQLDNLLKKGNKWYKRCGFMDLPKRKIRKTAQ